MRIGRIDTVTSKRGKSGDSTALDLMPIPARSMTLNEGKVDRFRERHWWLRYRADGKDCEGRSLGNGALYKAHHLEKSSTNVRFGSRDKHMLRHRCLLSEQTCTFVRCRESSFIQGLFPVLTSRHQLIYALMYEDDLNPR